MLRSLFERHLLELLGYVTLNDKPNLTYQFKQMTVELMTFTLIGNVWKNDVGPISYLETGIKWMAWGDRNIYLENGVGDGGEGAVVGVVGHFEDVQAPVVEVHHQLQTFGRHLSLAGNVKLPFVYH